MKDYSLADLERWGERIEERARAAGLDFYPQEFEICDHNQMLAYMAYSGLPSHYPHWSYGKSFERLKTLYEYGVSGLPYEMVINSNPCLAYLMRDNSLLLQIMTMAHVYGHNDFFKKNFTFQTTRAELTIDRFKIHALRVRQYIEDPSIGLDRVEKVLDAAQALSFQRRRNMAGIRLTQEEARERLLDRIARRKEEGAADGELPDPEEVLRKSPVEPEEDLLLFMRDHSRHLSSWEQDLLGIVDEEASYFIPQIETKIMNEGWASYWHKFILDGMDLPQDLKLEFMVRHSQVLAPPRGGLNPYHLGFALWNGIRTWYDGAQDPSRLGPDELDLFQKMRDDFEERDAVPPDTGRRSGKEALFHVREVDRDTSFLRRFLSPALMQELDLFQHEPSSEKGERLRVVTKTSGSDDWKDIKATLLQNVGMGSFPVLQIIDADFMGNATLLLKHLHDGRDLELEAAQKSLQHVHHLWGNSVVLQTLIDGRGVEMRVSSRGEFSMSRS